MYLSLAPTGPLEMLFFEAIIEKLLYTLLWLTLAF